jgi:hypothetical protein
MILKGYAAQGVGENTLKEAPRRPPIIDTAGLNDFDREAQKRVGKKFERIQLAGPQHE